MVVQLVPTEEIDLVACCVYLNMALDAVGH